MRAFAIVLCAFPLAAVAQDIDCSDVQTQADLNGCVYQQWQAADATLNAVYADALARMQQFDADSSPGRTIEETRLRRAQRAWVAFRDANCEMIAVSARGGTGHDSVINHCLVRMTEERTAELQTLGQGH